MIAGAQLPDPKQAARQLRQPGVVPGFPAQPGVPGQPGQPGSTTMNLMPSSYTNPEVERKLMAVVFPKFFVKDKTITDLANELAQSSKAVDPEGKGLTFEVFKPELVRPITIDAEDIMLSRILMRIVEASGNSCFVQETPTGIRIIGW
jgi:hypothetical protein